MNAGGVTEMQKSWKLYIRCLLKIVMVPILLNTRSLFCVGFSLSNNALLAFSCSLVLNSCSVHTIGQKLIRPKESILHIVKHIFI